jgi:hypothetical protein
MEEITIVKRRSRLWPLLLLLIVIALVVAAAIWFMNERQVDQFGVNNMMNEAGAIARPILQI